MWINLLNVDKKDIFFYLHKSDVYQEHKFFYISLKNSVIFSFFSSYHIWFSTDFDNILFFSTNVSELWCTLYLKMQIFLKIKYDLGSYGTTLILWRGCVIFLFLDPITTLPYFLMDNFCPCFFFNTNTTARINIVLYLR